MKRNIMITLACLLCAPCMAGTYFPAFRCESSLLTVENDGGGFYISIKQVPPSDNALCYIYDIGDDLKAEDSGDRMKLCRKTQNNGLYVEFKPRNTAGIISGKIKLTCTLTRTDAMDLIISPNPGVGKIDIGDIGIGGETVLDKDMPQSVVHGEFEIDYNYFGIMYLYPGMIEAPSRIYDDGDRPANIMSLAPAVCGRCSDIAYVWEKKYPDADWTEISGQSGEECVPDIMGTQSVKYRRKAVCHGDPKYSNVVEIKSVLNAGIIGLEESNASSIVLTNERSPSVASSQITWEQSADLKDWTRFASSCLTCTIPKPDGDTYYRRVATSLDKSEVKYSNTVCFVLTEPVSVSIRTALDSLGENNRSSRIFYDGLGRPAQEVYCGYSSSLRTRIKIYSYDVKGRQSQTYLPFACSRLGQDDSFVNFPTQKQNEYYGGKYPYTETEYDGSPLDRVISTTRPGGEYRSGSERHSVAYSYGLNAADDVLSLSVSSDSLSVDGLHPAGTLYKTTVTDEDGHKTETYTDSYGRTVLVRQISPTDGCVETYYAYDDMNRLVWVVSPNGSCLLELNESYDINSDFARLHCYRYKYSYVAAGLKTDKYLPGSTEPEITICDNAGRVVETSTAATRKHKMSYKNRYDSFGRLSGTVVSVTTGRLDISFEYETALFKYDSYDTSSSCFASQTFQPVDGVVSSADVWMSVKGMKTHEKIYECIDPANLPTETFACRTFYYDIRRRPVQIVERSSTGEELRTSYKYDYIGNPLICDEQYTFDGETVSVRKTYTYDTYGRITKEKVSVDGVEQTDVSNTYDDMGRIYNVSFGNGLRTYYRYNIQGWLTGKVSVYKTPSRFDDIRHPINGYTGLEAPNLSAEGLIFGTKLQYYDPIAAAPLYSGNISETLWSRSADEDAYLCAYTYDDFGRLKDADLTRGDVCIPYGENGIIYDRNGNLQSFERSDGSESTCRFGYYMDGNRIDMVSVSDVSTTGQAVNRNFTYDDMGNITNISGDDLEIGYNFLNLPREIKESGTVVSKYTYLSDGKKVSSCDADGNGYMYFGTARFTLDNNVPTFESIPFSGGRIVKTSNGYEPQYYLTDHLGSTRMIVNKDGKTVEATFDYTPFGVQIVNSQMPTNSTEYRFSGKELQNISDYEIYDFGARQYFPKYAIWGSVDPLSETYYPISPYAYCANNPVLFVDPDGERAKVSIDAKNQRVVISANIYINSNKYSDRELRSIANKIHSDIVNKWDKNWTYTDGDKKYSVKFNVRVIPGTEKRENTVYDNFIAISDIKTSLVKPDMMNGEWNMNHKGVSAHEFGHLLGLTDHYIEGKDEFGKRKTPPEEGWEGNIMASGNGEVEQRNIDDILYKIFTMRRNKSWIEKLFDNKDNYLIDGVKK